MPQYLLSVYGDETEFAAAEANPEMIKRLYAQVDTFNDRVKNAGAWVFGGGLHPTSTATVVRADSDADAVMTDGPFIEAKEQLGGFWIIEAPDLDAALTWAKDASAACEGPVEVRPFQSEDA
ncbi:MAG TPA: YciI family protein [Actinomycetes bacterium]|nr:YciI family protein [Actinomycetes bacterium]